LKSIYLWEIKALEKRYIKATLKGNHYSKKRINTSGIDKSRGVLIACDALRS